MEAVSSLPTTHSFAFYPGENELIQFDEGFYNSDLPNLETSNLVPDASSTSSSPSSSYVSSSTGNIPRSIDKTISRVNTNQNSTTLETGEYSTFQSHVKSWEPSILKGEPLEVKDINIIVLSTLSKSGIEEFLYDQKPDNPQKHQELIIYIGCLCLTVIPLIIYIVVSLYLYIIICCNYKYECSVGNLNGECYLVSGLHYGSEHGFKIIKKSGGLLSIKTTSLSHKFKDKKVSLRDEDNFVDETESEEEYENIQCDCDECSDSEVDGDSDIGLKHINKD
ncbi:hypothetical protein ACTFIY_008898 [Dictyostelium cf. discoideum]